MIFAVTISPDIDTEEDIVQAVISAPSHAAAVNLLQAKCNEIAASADLDALNARTDYSWSAINELTPPGILLASYTEPDDDRPPAPPGYHYEGDVVVRDRQILDAEREVP